MSHDANAFASPDASAIQANAIASPDASAIQAKKSRDPNKVKKTTQDKPRDPVPQGQDTKNHDEWFEKDFRTNGRIDYTLLQKDCVGDNVCVGSCDVHRGFDYIVGATMMETMTNREEAQLAAMEKFKSDMKFAPQELTTRQKMYHGNRAANKVRKEYVRRARVIVRETALQEGVNNVLPAAVSATSVLLDKLSTAVDEQRKLMATLPPGILSIGNSNKKEKAKRQIGLLGRVEVLSDGSAADPDTNAAAESRPSTPGTLMNSLAVTK